MCGRHPMYGACGTVKKPRIGMYGTAGPGMPGIGIGIGIIGTGMGGMGSCPN